MAGLLLLGSVTTFVLSDLEFAVSDPFQDDGERERSDHIRGDTAISRRYMTRNRSALVKISYNPKCQDFTEKTIDYKEPSETLQVVEALQTYTMALSRVWPEDRTGHTL